MNGGYLMVSKSDTNLYTKLNNALTTGKPVLFYEDANTCYYIDTITKSGTDIVLTKGGKTITIENDGDITEVGNIQPTEKHLYKHYIRVTDSAHYNIVFSFELLLSHNTVINTEQLLIDNLENNKKYAVHAMCESNTHPSFVNYISYTHDGLSGHLEIDGWEYTSESLPDSPRSAITTETLSFTDDPTFSSITDTVTQIF